jgi:hypothetical protein
MLLSTTAADELTGVSQVCSLAIVDEIGLSLIEVSLNELCLG